jgi:hypothetical protein
LNPLSHLVASGNGSEIVSSCCVLKLFIWTSHCLRSLQACARLALGFFRERQIVGVCIYERGGIRG